MFFQKINRAGSWLAALGAALLFQQCAQPASNPEPTFGQNADTTNIVKTIAGSQGQSVYEQLAIRPPFKDIDVPFQRFAVSAKKGAKLQISTGTEIEIPADAFVDKDGNAVQGEVEIRYREFHDAADIVASGIPMHDPATGAYMETAGMFEIRGSAGGGDVEIASGKQVMVRCASFNDSDVRGKNQTFDFFQLEQPSCKWQTKGNPKPEKNKNKEIALRELNKKLPERPVRPSKRGDTDKFVFDLDVDYTFHPELRAFKGVIWEYAGDPNAKENNPEKDKSIFSETWASIELKRGSSDAYLLCMTNGQRRVECPVRPVLKGGDYDKAMAAFEERMGKYERMAEAQKDTRNRINQQADLLRSFALQQFGIYNWDIWKNPQRLTCKPQLTLADAVMDEIKETFRYFLITESDRSVVQYSYDDLKKYFSFDPGAPDNKLLAVLPNNRIALFDADDFKRINPEAIRQGVTFSIHMRVVPNTLNSVDDLERAIAGR